MRLALCAIFLLAVAGQARAYPFDRKTPPPSPDRKSPAVAALVSLGVTAAGGALTAAAFSEESTELFVFGGAALWLGPSTGRWYARAGNRTLITLFTRAASVGILAAGLHEDAQPIDSCDHDLDDCRGHDAAEARHDRKARALYLTGAAIWTAASAWDIVRAPLDAREFNRTHELTVAPTVVPGGAGVAFAGRF